MLTLQTFLVYAFAGLSVTTAHALPPLEDLGAPPKSNPVVPKPGSVEQAVAPEIEPFDPEIELFVPEPGSVAPRPGSVVIPPQVCAVPEVAFIGLAAPFTLSVFIPGFETYPLSLPAEHSKYGDQPFITTPAPKSKALFRLKEGKLTTGGPNNDKYTAYFGPVPPEYPPYYAPLLFGDEDYGVRFSGSYACGPNDSLVLVLSSPRLIVPSLTPGAGIFEQAPFDQNKTIPIQLVIYEVTK